MGLLDTLTKGTGDPERDRAMYQGLLQAGLSLLGSRGNFGSALGQAGMQGLQGFQQSQDRSFQNQQRKLQMQQMQRQQAMQALPQQFATGGMKPPTMDNRDVGQPGEAPIQAKGYDFGGYADALAQYDPSAAIAMQASLRAKPDDYKVVGDALVQVGPGGVKEAYRAPEKLEKEPEALRAIASVYGKGSPEYVKASRDYITKTTTHQPGTSVSVNTGQKGFDNTLKLRGDFRAEPVYKAHQEVQSAHSQIKQALALQSPAGDLAGATKVMKILDPGSVVRESELGMAMAASGLLDRVQNYATNVLKGTKLTPTQRADFQKLADALYGESVKAYNAKRGEYQGISERNQLNTQDVLGPESATPQAIGVDSLVEKYRTR